MKHSTNFLLLSAAILMGMTALAGCPSANGNNDDPDDTTAPSVTITFPIAGATGTGINDTVRATFTKAMNPATIVDANFILLDGATPVLGKVTYDIPNKTAIFAPSVNLEYSTAYTATVKAVVADTFGNTMTNDKAWSFTTAAAGAGPAPVILGTAANFVILAKTEISTVPASIITGDVGLSPAAESYMTGFSQTKATGYSTTPQVTGYLYAADMTPPTPTRMTTAISDMETAYTDAQTRPAPDAANINIGGGNIGGLTFTPGQYQWGSPVTIASDITLSGGANDVWIFQISQELLLANAVSITLTGGARAKNVFWQVAGTATLGAYSHFEGIILGQTAISLETGASINGRILAQSMVALDQAVVTKPN